MHIPKLFPKVPRIDDLQVYTSQLLEGDAPLHSHLVVHLHSSPIFLGTRHNNPVLKVRYDYMNNGIEKYQIHCIKFTI